MKNPDLKRMVLAVREAQPTPDEVHRACRDLRARDEAVTILGVARLLGRGRHTIERSRMLRAVVDEHQKAVQKALEAELRAAMKAILAEGHVVTMAGVCRRIGRDRSYVEKRARLQLLVMSAGRPASR